jgi:hypothetical protein
MRLRCTRMRREGGAEEDGAMGREREAMGVMALSRSDDGGSASSEGGVIESSHEWSMSCSER